ncbi:MAG: hypothetical protein DCC65_07855 [Planctomycetota bacterium]|nr:MAG: hypothetical protein DCC65_07855 [Planctomycetota bacterium]
MMGVVESATQTHANQLPAPSTTIAIEMSVAWVLRHAARICSGIPITTYAVVASIAVVVAQKFIGRARFQLAHHAACFDWGDDAYNLWY